MGSLGAAVACTSPPLGAAAGEEVQVAVSVDGGLRYGGESAPFVYAAPLAVDSAAPFVATTPSGARDARLRVRGRGLPARRAVWCVFSDLASGEALGNASALHVSATAAECPLAAAVADQLQVGASQPAVSVRLATSEPVASSAAVAVEQRPRPRAFRAVPALAAFEGGTEVDVTGTGFVESAELACVLEDEAGVPAAASGEAAVPASFIGPTQLRCSLPALRRDLAGDALKLWVTVDGMQVSQEPVTIAVQALPVLHAVRPSVAPLRGGTSLRVEGEGFPDAPTLLCRFAWAEEAVAAQARRANVTPPDALFSAEAGEAVAAWPLTQGALQIADAPATFLSTKAVRCEAPAVRRPGPMTVRVSANGADFTVESIALRAARLPRVHAVAPHAVEVGSEAQLRVAGRYFAGDDVPTCHFVGPSPAAAEHTRAAEVRGDGEVRCAVPGELRPGHHAVEVSANGVDASRQGTALTVHPRVRLHSVAPSVVPSTGGTRLAVYGTGFRPEPTLACRVGRHEVAAQFVSASEVRCTVPRAAAAAAAANGSAVVDVALDAAGPAPAGPAARALEVMVVAPWRLRGLSPAYGPLAGGTEVRVRGEGFVAAEGGQPSCRFLTTGGASTRALDEDLMARATVPAVVESATSLRCTAPAAVSTLRFNHHAAPVAVGVTMNGADWARDAAARYTYVVRPVVASVQPQLVAERERPVVLDVRGKGFAAAAPTFCAVRLAEGLDAVGLSLHVGAAVGAGAESEDAPWVGVVAAQVVDDARLRCRWPELRLRAAAGAPWRATDGARVEVGVSVNGMDWSATARRRGATVLLHPPVSPVAVRPLALASGLGGSASVHFDGGASLADRIQPWCRWDASVLHAGAAASEAGGTVVVRCPLPPALRGAGRVALEASLDGAATWWDAPSKVLLYAPPRAAAVAPRHVHASGGAPLVVRLEAALPRGTEAAPWIQPACRFQPWFDPARPAPTAAGASLAPRTAAATLLNATHLSCPAPSLPAGARAAVAVSLNGQDFAASRGGATEVVAVAPPFVARAHPTRIPKNGGTVTLQGGEFLPVPDLRCAWAPEGTPFGAGALTTEVVLVNGRRVKCRGPSQAAVAAHFPGLGPVPRVQVTVTLNDRAEFAAAQKPRLFGAREDEAGAAPVGTALLVAYRAPPRIQSLHPGAGPHYGGTEVVLRGDPFEEDASYACWFGEEAGTPAAFLNASALLCIAPTLPQGRHAVRVAEAGQLPPSPTADAAQFVSAPARVLRGVEPAVVAAAGGTVVTLRGEGWGQHARAGAELPLACAFGDGRRVAARVQNDTHASCATPPLDALVSGAAAIDAAGLTAQVRVTQADGTVRGDATGAQGLRYVPVPVTGRVVPATVPNTGGTPLAVHGRSFPPSMLLACLFLPTGAGPGVAAAAFSPAAVRSAQLVFCPAPSVSWVGRSRVLVVGHADAVRIASQARSPAEALLLASDLGCADQRAFVDHDAPAEVHRLEPATGPATGGTRVVVRGAGFPTPHAAAAGQLFCHFGGAEMVPAAFLNATALSCVAPPLAPKRSVPVSVSVTGGADWLPGQLTFTTLPTLRVAAVRPPRLLLDGASHEVTLEADGVPADGAASLRCRFLFAGAGPGAADVRKESAAHAGSEAGNVRCVAPVPPLAAGGAAVARVQLSVNGGVDFTPGGPLLFLVPPPVLRDVAPRVLYAVPARRASAAGSESSLSLRAARGASASVAVTVTGLAEASAAGRGDLLCRVLRAGGDEAFRGPLRRDAARPGKWHCDVDAEALSSLAAVEAGTLQLSPNGGEQWAADAGLTLAPAPSVVSVDPVAVPERGGIALTLRGRGLHVHPSRAAAGPAAVGPASSAYCRIGAAVVPALPLDANAIQCLAPPVHSAVGRVRQRGGGVRPDVAVDVALSLDGGATFLGRPLAVRYVAPRPALVLDPSFASTEGGTQVTVRVAAAADTAAVAAAESGVLAAAPAWDAAAFVSNGGRCEVGGERSAPAGVAGAAAVVCEMPPRHVAGRVGVRLLGASGAPVTSATALLRYVAVPVVTHVAPGTGPSGGGFPVRVFGANMSDVVAEPRCRFGEAEVPAQRWSPTEWRCIAPAHHPGRVSVQASADGGRTWSRAQHVLGYTPAARIARLEPAGGPAGGGTLVRVLGANLVPPPGLARTAAPLQCRFGAGPFVPAHPVSSGEVLCVSPPLPDAQGRVVDVAVTRDNGTLARSVGGFTLVDPANVSAVVPAALTVSRDAEGGPPEVVAVGGPFSGPRGALAPLCVFEGHAPDGARVHATSPAHVQDPRRLRCAVPRVPALVPREGGLTLEVRVTMAGAADASLHGAPLRLLPLPHIHAVAPRTVPAYASGEDAAFVTLTVGGLVRVPHLACRFGPSGEGTPAAAAPGALDVVRAHMVDGAHVSCEAPPGPPGPVAVAVTLDGRTFSAPALLRRDYAPSPRAVRPTRVFGRGGGTPLHITGAHFRNSTALACRVGGVRSRAWLVTSQHVVCVAPAVGGGQRNTTGTLALQVSNDGVTYFPRPAQRPVPEKVIHVQYARNCPRGFYCPGQQARPCPNGTYCGPDTRAFLLCPPGTFQPRVGQSECLPCPVGFFCPDQGLSQPVLCPAGYVCDTLELVTPTRLCPRGHFCPPGTKSAAPDDFVHVVGSAGTPLWVEDEETHRTAFNDSARAWTLLRRPDPATGFSRPEHPSRPDAAAVADPHHEARASRPPGVALMAERPYPCPLGMYCLPGAATAADQALNFSTPQRCMDGYFCPRGSSSPEGKGPCPTGYYCPTQTDAVVCPRGHFCPGVANLAPVACVPGTYSPELGRTNCTACPPGHVCPRYAMLQPETCPAGFICVEHGLPEPVVECPPGYYCPNGTVSENPDAGTAVATATSADGSVLANQPASVDAATCAQPNVTCTSEVEAARAYVLASLVSGSAAPTHEYMESAPLAPQPCSPGTFCLGGVAHDMVTPWLPTVPEGRFAPQLCREGTFCGEATPVTAGTGLCFPGHYCPPGLNFPVKAPLGSFAGGNGSIVPTLCFPGTYAPLKSTVECKVCPAGFECASYGTFVPTICAPGTYRSLADSITCRLCPEGTFSPHQGLQDISLCEPCPRGRVCGLDQMTNLSQSLPCPAGYTCGDATSKATQFDTPCPAGYYCAAATPPDQLFDNRCDPGFYCLRGTEAQFAQRNTCPVGFYCPSGTASEEPQETRTPRGTTTFSGATSLPESFISEVDICDKDPLKRYIETGFSYQHLGERKTVVSGEVEVLERIIPVNVSRSDPYWRNNTIEPMRTCPENGTEAGGTLLTVIGRNFRDTPSLRCKFVHPEWSHETAAVFLASTRVACRTPRYRATAPGTVQVLVANERRYSLSGPNFTFVPASVYAGNSAAAAAARASCIGVDDEELSFRAEVDGWFALRGLNMAFIQLDWRHLPPQMVYGDSFRIAIYVSPSVCQEPRCDAERNRIQNTAPDYEIGELEETPCTKPIALSPWLLSDQVSKRDLLNITLTALEDVVFRVEAQIMHGRFLPTKHLLLNTTTVRIVGPERARSTFGLTGSDMPTRRLSDTISFEEANTALEWTFVAVYGRERTNEVSAPFNLPDRYKATERGRVLVGYNTTLERRFDVPAVLDDPATVKRETAYWQPPDEVEFMAFKEKYREYFDQVSLDASGQLSYNKQPTLVLPWLPYVSSCRGYDSHIPIFRLLESPQCQLPEVEFEEEGQGASNWWRRDYPPLPHQDDIKPVLPLDLMQDPVADWCEQRLLCNYEEDLTTTDAERRWFEAASGTELFYILEEALTLSQIKQGGDLIEDMVAKDSSDILIPVSVDRSAAEELREECGRLCFPREVTLEITYYQINEREKRIISATMVYGEFDRTPAKTEYVFNLSYSALNYIQLIIAFAFDVNVFVLLFLALGGATVMAAIFVYLFNRLATRLEHPPRFRFMQYLRIVAPPPLTGIGLALVPTAIILGSIHYLLRGFEYSSSSDTLDRWLLDNVVEHYSDTRIDTNRVPLTRRGRVGTAFFIAALFGLVVGSRVLVPESISREEREVVRKQSKQARQEAVWTPTRWKRNNFIFLSVILAFVMVLGFEFSFWTEFGTYIWHVIFALRAATIPLEVILEVRLQEVLLMSPLIAAFMILQQLVAFGADDFVDFVLSFAIEYAIAVVERIYIAPSAKRVVFYLRRKTANIMRFLRKRIRFRKRSRMELQALRREEARAARKQREVELEGGGETVEPILESFGEYTSEVVSLLLMPAIVVFLMFFREDVAIPDLYGIRSQDMEFYLIFQVLIVPFIFAADIFLHNTQEVFHGWKLYDYLVYAKYRFTQRESRWKGMEESLDECIEEGMRTLDQLCFSSQYYFITTIHTVSILLLSMGCVVMLRVTHNPFGDPATLLLVPGILLLCYITQRLCLRAADLFGLWKLETEDTPWADALPEDEDEDLAIPRWEELEKLKGASHEAYLMNQRITSETFRHKFLDYNRPWLVAQLPSVLTPRTLRRSRPYLVAQFTKLLGSVRPDISESESEEKEAVEKFPPVALSASSRAIIRMWLAQARRRRRLREVVQPIINRARRAECEQCLSRRGLQVELVQPIEQLADAFEAEHPNMEEFDQVAWKEYFAKHASFRTICMNCIADEKERARRQAALPFAVSDTEHQEEQHVPATFGPVFLSPASDAIMRMWYARARRRLVQRGYVPAEPPSISDDEEEEDETGEVPWRQRSLHLSAASRAIAVRWLRTARAEMMQRGAVPGE